MSTNSYTEIIEEYLHVRNFNKTMYYRGAVTEKEFDEAQKKTLWKYAGELCDGEWLDLSRAAMDLLQAEIDEQKVVEEYAYMARGEN